ncbi:MAG: hypothetical protein CML92_01880, partial [Rhodobiaceae bacterium]|nr:hypothetical protein [Rhodobiaceae bacterium]
TPKPGGFYPKRAKRIEIFQRSKIFDLLYRWRCRHSKTSFKCVNPVRNYDGDTITVNIDRVHPIIGDEISIRVIGIDTAEIRTSDQCEKDMAYKAKDFVEKEIMGARRINLNKISRDKYFRIAADVIIDGVSLSKKLIDEALKRVNHQLSTIEKVKNYIIVDEEFTVENEMMTPSMKIKRYKVLEKYEDALRALYTI